MTTLISGYLGIDLGTQGVSVLFCREPDLQVVAMGEATYGFSTTPQQQQEHGWYEQDSSDWIRALQAAMTQLRQRLANQTNNNDNNNNNNNNNDNKNAVDWQILAIGVAGQMHGQVLWNEQDQVLAPVRLWCDARNDLEGQALSTLLQCKIPKRATCARFWGTWRDQPEWAAATRHITTPAGWLAVLLTGQYQLGIGDAAGMFPVDPHTLSYDAAKLALYNQHVAQDIRMNRSRGRHNHDDNDQEEAPIMFRPLQELLPTIRCAGQDAGYLTESGAALLGIPYDHHHRRIPVAAAEGDQVATLAGSLIGQVGTLSCSFGTSVCANFIADADASSSMPHTVLPAVDHFCAANGSPIHMVLLRNGTTFWNTVVESYYGNKGDSKVGGGGFEQVMPALLAAPPDCGGLLALPFMDDEPGLLQQQQPQPQDPKDSLQPSGSSSSSSTCSTACIVGWNAHNNQPGYVAKAALLSTLFNLKLGWEQFWQQQQQQQQHSDDHPKKNNNNAMREIVLSGGLVKTPECGQIVADVFQLPVTLLTAADEGCAWGACVLAQYRYQCWCDDQEEQQQQQQLQSEQSQPSSSPTTMDWVNFLESKKMQQQQDSTTTTKPRSFVPDPEAVRIYEQVYQRYQLLLQQVEPVLRRVMTTTNTNTTTNATTSTTK
ncbi:hypothetical protein ACA910_021799 [Epithemia clementina (nom. ined.)]